MNNIRKPRDRDEMLELAFRLKKCFNDFGIAGDIVEINHDTDITVYKFEPSDDAEIFRIMINIEYPIVK